MQQDEKPKDEKPEPDSKATAPPAMPALSPREAARLWGIGSSVGPRDGVRRRYPFSKM